MNAASSKTTGVLARLVASLVVVVITVFGLGWELPHWLLGEEFSSNWTLILLSVGSIIPFFFTKDNGSAYSDLSQLFHRLVLDNYFLGKKLLGLQIKGVGTESVQKANTLECLLQGLLEQGLLR